MDALALITWPFPLQVVLNLGTLQNSHEGRISCLGLSADGSALCTGSWDTNLKVSLHYYIFVLMPCHCLNNLV